MSTFWLRLQEAAFTTVLKLVFTDPGFFLKFQFGFTLQNLYYPTQHNYSEISWVHLFYPTFFEILSPINQVGQDFISKLGRWISPYTVTTNVRPLFSVAVQRLNAVSFTHSSSLTRIDAVPHTWKHIIVFNCLLTQLSTFSFH